MYRILIWKWFIGHTVLHIPFPSGKFRQGFFSDTTPGSSIDCKYNTLAVVVYVLETSTIDCSRINKGKFLGSTR